jgi:hypothetical protein
MGIPQWDDQQRNWDRSCFDSFRSHKPCDECPSLNAVPLAPAAKLFAPRCRIDRVLVAACSLLSVSFWNFSCRPIVRVLPSVPPVVPVHRLGRGRPMTSCSRSNSNVPRTMISELGCPTTREVPVVDRAETRAETRAARRSPQQTRHLPRKGLAVAGPLPASRE